MTRVPILALLLVGLLPAAAHADDAATARRERLERAGRLVETGLAALREGRADAALEALTMAREAAPDEAVVAYDHALALAAAGRLDDARKAYADAVRAADADDPAGPAARHNLGTLRLAAARDAERLLRDPDALADAIREQGAPTGQPLTPATIEMLARERRGQLVEQGLAAARESVDLLRAAVRADASATDALRNLVLAQRTRRFLEEEQRRQRDEPQKGGEDGDDTSPPQGDGSEQGTSDTRPEGDGEQNDPQAGDTPPDAAPQQPETGPDGEQTPPAGDAPPETAATPRDLGREEAERALERILEAAARKARLVEQLRAERLRRGAVEKDW